ncbi:MAG: hypothetical protein IID41_14200 [Planctomycetes bacterium]|nr:hypothetical protein [Planctomycetota bacterium]
MNRVEAIGKDSMLHQAIAGVSRRPALKIAKWALQASASIKAPRMSL